MFGRKLKFYIQRKLEFERSIIQIKKVTLKKKQLRGSVQTKDQTVFLETNQVKMTLRIVPGIGGQFSPEAQTRLLEKRKQRRVRCFDVTIRRCPDVALNTPGCEVSPSITKVTGRLSQREIGCTWTNPPDVQYQWYRLVRYFDQFVTTTSLRR